jgi:diguanylate cyclase (GGDEF)-like protein
VTPEFGREEASTGKLAGAWHRLRVERVRSAAPRPAASIVARLANVLQATVALVERGPIRWHVIASHEVARPVPAAHGEIWTVLDQDAAATQAGLITTPHEATWTSVPVRVHPHRRAALLVAGDWRNHVASLIPIGDELARLRGESERLAAVLRRASHRLARQLGQVEGLSLVCDAIVDAMTAAVGARLGVVALADESERRLAIRATHGYPLVLVEHLRIDPGEGVLGRVYESAKVLRVPGGVVGAAPARTRPRYRTGSFIALPIVAGEEVLAVLSVADPLDEEAFTRADLSTLCALAAPAALALARERATARAEAFAHAAAIDAVSGLFNRRYFHVRLEEELQRSRRHEIPLALLMIDIDDFKAINDRYGHLAGDSVIKSAADIVRRAVRVFDVCTRFGGEEFAVIMPGSHEESAAAVAERIRARVAGHRTTDRALDGLNVTVSIGLAVSAPGMSSRELITRADEALYLAKRAGKNQVRSATSSGDGD